jgi:mono/diheme cytochrome c family protein
MSKTAAILRPQAFSASAALVIAAMATACAPANHVPQPVFASPDQGSQKVQFPAVGQIFNDKCVSCHSDNEAMGGVNLASYEKVLSSIPAVVIPGQAQQSRLYLSVKSGRMPLVGGPLSEIEIESIRRWISDGCEP